MIWRAVSASSYRSFEVHQVCEKTSERMFGGSFTYLGRFYNFAESPFKGVRSYRLMCCMGKKLIEPSGAATFSVL